MGVSKCLILVITQQSSKTAYINAVGNQFLGQGNCMLIIQNKIHCQYEELPALIKKQKEDACLRNRQGFAGIESAGRISRVRICTFN